MLILTRSEVCVNHIPHILATILSVGSSISNVPPVSCFSPAYHCDIYIKKIKLKHSPVTSSGKRHQRQHENVPFQSNSDILDKYWPIPCVFCVCSCCGGLRPSRAQAPYRGPVVQQQGCGAFYEGGQKLYACGRAVPQGPGAGADHWKQVKCLTANATISQSHLRVFRVWHPIFSWLFFFNTFSASTATPWATSAFGSPSWPTSLLRQWNTCGSEQHWWRSFWTK